MRCLQGLVPRQVRPDCSLCCFCGGLHWWETNKNGEVSLRLTALWLSVARLHLRERPLGEEEEGGVKYSRPGLWHFFANNTKQIPLIKSYGGSGWWFRCGLRLFIGLNGHLTSPHSPKLNRSRCNERAAEAAGEASADSLLVSPRLPLFVAALVWLFHLYFQSRCHSTTVRLSSADCLYRAWLKITTRVWAQPRAAFLPGRSHGWQ